MGAAGFVLSICYDLGMHYLHPGQLWSPCDTPETVARPLGERTSEIPKVTCAGCIERLPAHLFQLLSAAEAALALPVAQRNFVIDQMSDYIIERKKREEPNESA